MKVAHKRKKTETLIAICPHCRREWKITEDATHIPCICGMVIRRDSKTKTRGEPTKLTLDAKLVKPKGILVDFEGVRPPGQQKKRSDKRTRRR